VLVSTAVVENDSGLDNTGNRMLNTCWSPMTSFYDSPLRPPESVNQRLQQQADQSNWSAILAKPAGEGSNGAVAGIQRRWCLDKATLERHRLLGSRLLSNILPLPNAPTTPVRALSIHLKHPTTASAGCREPAAPC